MGDAVELAVPPVAPSLMGLVETQVPPVRHGDVDMNTIDSLKPCPFCASPDCTVVRGEVTRRVVCRDCGARTKPYSKPNNAKTVRECTALAIIAWNRRPTPSGNRVGPSRDTPDRARRSIP